MRWKERVVTFAQRRVADMDSAIADMETTREYAIAKEQFRRGASDRVIDSLLEQALGDNHIVTPPWE